MTTALDSLETWADIGAKFMERLNEKMAETVPERRYSQQEILSILPNIDLSKENLEAEFHIDQHRLNELIQNHGQQLTKQSCSVISVQNQKGGCWKTFTCGHLASYLAMHGYRVCMIDMDPQASLTVANRYIPDIDITDEDTITPWLLDQAQGRDITELLKDTRNPNLKLIPGCLGIGYAADAFAGAVSRAHAMGDLVRGHAYFNALNRALAPLRERFDAILIDGTPSTGALAMNIVSASDVCLVTVPTEAPDFASTVRYIQLLHDYYSSFIDNYGSELSLPDFWIQPTRFSSMKTAAGNYTLQMINKTFGDKTLQVPLLKHDAAVGTLNNLRATIFDLNDDGKPIRKEQYLRCLQNVTECMDNIHRQVILPLTVE